MTPHPPATPEQCPYWNPEKNLYPEEPDNHCQMQFSKLKATIRNQTLDEAISFVKDQEIFTDEKGDTDENYITANGWYSRSFQCAEIRKHLESLRSPEAPK